MPTFRAAYDIAATMQATRAPLWASVRREASWVRDLVCLIGVDLRRAYSCRVLASDANEDGYGVMSA